MCKEFENKCNEFRENKRLIEELTALNEALKQDIIELMNGQEVMTSGACKASYKDVNSVRFDSSSFKKEHADLYDQYAKASTYKRFIVQ